MAEFCGGGFRDTTRIAAGSEEVWHDIVKTNRDPVVNELEGLCTELEKLTEMIRAGDFDSLRGYLSRSAELRRSFNRK
jgi:prephenate dehydrogenase